MIVQIYEVGSPAEAAALSWLGADHIGVLVGPGRFPGEIGFGEAGIIFAAVGPASKKVALTLSGDASEIEETAGRLLPDILHVGTLPERAGPADLLRVKRRMPHLKIMRSIAVTGEDCIDAAREYAGIADYLLLDTHLAGDSQIGATGETHDWGISRRIVSSVNIPSILAGGLGPDNVAEAIRLVRPAGVDSKTKTDLPDGSGKDLDKVRGFIQAARAAGEAFGPLPGERNTYL
ncbi:MAG TPA: phosphoribosylanthranilate isomerase [Syntrophales bacterium]|nr:phosphoribosylanthranilate isomerase [Syntrophales bacterium]